MFAATDFEIVAQKPKISVKFSIRFCFKVSWIMAVADYSSVKLQQGYPVCWQQPVKI